MTYKDRANTPTEALALDILNAYFANTYGPGHQVAQWAGLTTDQQSLGMQMVRSVKDFDADGTYNDLVTDILNVQNGTISARALASKIWPRIASQS